MSFYGRLADTAHRLIADKGRPVTLLVEASGAYNPTTGQAARTTTNVPALGVVIDYPLKDIDGTLVRQGDKRVLVSPRVAARPKPGDGLLIGAVTHTVITAKPLEPAGETTLWTLQARMP